MKTTLLAQPGELSLVLNPVEYRMQDNTEWPETSYLVLHLYVETEADTGNFQKVAEFEEERDSQNSATFDISESLEAYLQYYFTSSDAPTLQKCRHLAKKYYVEYGFRTGPEAVFADLTAYGPVGEFTYLKLPRVLREGKPYHLLIHTADLASAQGVTFRYTSYSNAEVLAGASGFTNYKGMIYAVFTPPATQQHAYQEVRVPNGTRVQIYVNYSLLTTGESKTALLAGWHHLQYPGRTGLLPGGRKILTTAPLLQHAYDGQWIYLYYLPSADEA